MITNKAEQLRELLEKSEVIRVVGAHDGLTAKLAEKHGFEGVWASGFEISTSYAVPDANILTMTELLHAAEVMNGAISIPVIADCDTGYGNAHNVIHMVRRYESGGIAAVAIEDKVFPKLNSYVAGRQELVTIEEFTGKIRAAKESQKTKEFMVIARVEALIAGFGIPEAVKRATAYVAAGADAIIIHSKLQNPGQIEEFMEEWDFSAPIVIIPTSYPMITLDQIKKLGIKMVIYANQGIRAEIKAIDTVFSEINRSGRLDVVNDRIVPMDYVFGLQGMPSHKENEKRYISQ